MGDTFSVIFASSRADVSKHKVLAVSRTQYLRCARIRRLICPLVDVDISDGLANELCLQDGAP